MTASRLDERSDLAVATVLAIAAAFCALELAVAARYGIHRDELYFLACARHLAWGYVDQPPFVPAVARLSVDLFGTSAVALRILPMLSGGATVVLAAVMARDLGGSRRAQVVAALAAATSAQVLAADHLLSTASFDLFFWAAISTLFVRLLRTDDRRLWVAIGAVAGVGLMNKYNVAFLLLGMGLGVLLSGRGRILASRWLVLGAVAALVIFLPNLIWNAQHHWAALTMLRDLKRENSTLSASIQFIPSQFLVVGPFLVAVWVGGVRRLLRHAWARPVAIAYLVLLVLDTVTGAKSYYLGGIYFVLFAGGGIWADERLLRRGTGMRTLATWIVVGGVVALPLSLPVLPVTTLPSGDWESKINKDLSATVGWPRVVSQIAGVVATLPAPERAHVVVFTGDYGAAGAVDLYGRRFGLPRAISGHNTYWIWGPRGATDGATTIAVNLDRDYLLTIFSSVTPAGTVDTGHGVWTEERGDPIFVCRGQRVSWAAAWPAARHYG